MTDDGDPFQQEKVRDALARMSDKLPKQIRYRSMNSLRCFDRSIILFDMNLEMASFLAITGEEEASSALVHALKIRNYDDAKFLNPKNHIHKNAIIAAVIGIGNHLRPILERFQLIFDVNEPRIDLKIPLSNFGVSNGEKFALQPIEPLGILHSREGIPESRVFDDALANLSASSGFDDVRMLVNDRANQRNILIYASDDGLPASRTTPEAIRSRQDRATALLVLTVMILQSKDKLPLVRQAVSVVISIIKRLPAEE